MAQASGLFSSLLRYLPLNLAAAVVGFGGIWLFTRLLSPEEYGRYSLAFAAMMMVHTLLLTWVEAAAFRFLPQARAQGTSAAHFMTLSLAGAASGLLGLGVALILGWQWNVPQGLLIAALAGTSIMVRTQLRVGLESHRAEQRAGRYATLEIVHSLGGFILGAFLLAFTPLGPAAPFAGMLISAVLALGLDLPWRLRQMQGGQFDRASARAFAVFGMPVAASLVLELVLSVSDRLLIGAYLGEAQTGVYAAGYGLAARIMDILFVAAGLAASPITMAAFDTHGRQGAQAAARQTAMVFLALATPAALGLALVAEPLTHALVGPAMASQAAAIVPWIALAGLLSGWVTYYFSEPFQLTHNTLERALLLAIPAGLNIALNMLLLPLIGLVGAVLATLLAYLLAIGLLAWRGRRHLPLPLPLDQVWRVLLACAGLGIVVIVMPSPGGWLELGLKAGAGGLAYALCAFWLDVAGVRSWLKARRARSPAGEPPTPTPAPAPISAEETP